MFVDAHCHIDQYPDPHKVLRRAAEANVFVVGVTNSPSAYWAVRHQLASHKNLRLAVGLHPLSTEVGERDFALLESACNRTSYVGEVGLDASAGGLSSLALQEQRFRRVLAVAGRNKVYSIHARRAEQLAVEIVGSAGPKAVVFHWFSGAKGVLLALIQSGYYLSINPAMCRSSKGKDIVSNVPLDRLLTESDGPYLSIRRSESYPWDVREVIAAVAEIHACGAERIEKQVWANFRRLVECRD